MDAIRAIVEEKGLKWQVLQPKSMPSDTLAAKWEYVNFLYTWEKSAGDLSKARLDTVFVTTSKEARFFCLLQSMSESYPVELLIDKHWLMMTPDDGFMLFHGGEYMLAEARRLDIAGVVRRWLTRTNRGDSTCDVCFEDVTDIIDVCVTGCGMCGFRLCTRCRKRMHKSLCPQCRSTVVI